MQRLFRAAALSAAALFLGTAVGLSGPSIASESDAAPTISFTEHAGSALTVENLGLDQLVDPAQPAPGEDISAPVASHAMAPVFAEPEAAVETRPERDGRSLTQLVADYSGSQTPNAETDCLARAVYWESKGEPLAGQLTVAEVIINRSRSGRFASTVCGVVRQRGQFSFVRGGQIPVAREGSRDWRVAVAIARIARQELADGAAPRALFFHARHASPGWRLTRVATVGNHVFYR